MEEELLSLEILKPENIKDTLHAYQMAKRCNEKRVMYECIHWGERGARLNDIAPGIIVTPLAIDEFNGPRGDFYKNMFAKCPAGRPGTADEMANIAELLMSDAGAFITGSTFLADGGTTASYYYGPLQGKNDVTIDPFYMTDHGISVADIYNYVIYYGVILILVLPALIHGRRASCHYICWMAPFMIIGSTVGRWLRLPQLHIDADKDVCISCGKCNMSCPMGLNVKVMVLEGNNAKCTECIQCGACIDACPKKVLKYKLRWRQ